MKGRPGQHESEGPVLRPTVQRMPAQLQEARGPIRGASLFIKKKPFLNKQTFVCQKDALYTLEKGIKARGFSGNWQRMGTLLFRKAADPDGVRGTTGTLLEPNFLVENRKR